MNPELLARAAAHFRVMGYTVHPLSDSPFDGIALSAHDAVLLRVIGSPLCVEELDALRNVRAPVYSRKLIVRFYEMAMDEPEVVELS